MGHRTGVWGVGGRTETSRKGPPPQLGSEAAQTPGWMHQGLAGKVLQHGCDSPLICCGVALLGFTLPAGTTGARRTNKGLRSESVRKHQEGSKEPGGVMV